MPLPEIEEILQKFKREEERVETLLNEKFVKEEKSRAVPVENEFIRYEEVKNRNKRIIKDFEATKGRLRSKAIFCPTEIQWENVCREYQEQPSLNVTTWKCQPPVFV